MFSRSPRPKFQNHLVFITFHNRIFVFDKISKGMIVTIEKELGEYFQRLHFWNQWVPLIKTQCRVHYLLDFDLKLRSGQGWFVMFISLIIFFILFWLSKNDFFWWWVREISFSVDHWSWWIYFKPQRNVKTYS